MEELPEEAAWGEEPTEIVPPAPKKKDAPVFNFERVLDDLVLLTFLVRPSSQVTLAEILNVTASLASMSLRPRGPWSFACQSLAWTCHRMLQSLTLHMPEVQKT